MIVASETRINPVRDFFLARPLEVRTEAVPALETGLFQGAFSNGVNKKGRICEESALWRRKHLCASTIIDAYRGKKLQDFSRILQKFYKTVQKDYFNTKRPTRLGRPTKGVLSRTSEAAYVDR